MKNYLVDTNKKVLPLLGAQSFSTGDGLELSQRYSYDYSKSHQSLVFRRRNTALTASMQIQFTNRMCVEAGFMNILDYIDDLHDTTGRLFDLYWQARLVGRFIVISTQFSAVADAQQIFPAMAVSLAFTEGFIRRETLYTAVSTNKRPV